MRCARILIRTNRLWSCRWCSWQACSAWGRTSSYCRAVGFLCIFVKWKSSICHLRCVLFPSDAPWCHRDCSRQLFQCPYLCFPQVLRSKCCVGASWSFSITRCVRSEIEISDIMGLLYLCGCGMWVAASKRDLLLSVRDIASRYKIELFCCRCKNLIRDGCACVGDGSLTLWSCVFSRTYAPDAGKFLHRSYARFSHCANSGFAKFCSRSFQKVFYWGHYQFIWVLMRKPWNFLTAFFQRQSTRALLLFIGWQRRSWVLVASI